MNTPENWTTVQPPCIKGSSPFGFNWTLRDYPKQGSALYGNKCWNLGCTILGKNVNHDFLDLKLRS